MAPPHPAVVLALRILKAICIGLGFLLSVLCLMALVSLVTNNLVAQLVPALLVAGGVPLVVAERVSRDRAGRVRQGLASDVLACAWLGLPLLFVAGLHSVSGPLIVREAELLADTWADSLAPAVAWLARAPIEEPRPSSNPSQWAESADGTDDSSHPDGRDGGPDLAADGSSDGEAPPPEGSPSFDGGGEAPPPELAVAELRSTISPSIVTLSVRHRDCSLSSATGVVIDDGGHVATAASVVRDAAAIAIRLHDGTWLTRVSLEGAGDEPFGLAVLRAHADRPLQPLVARRQGALETDTETYLVGDPLGLGPTLTPTRVVAGQRTLFLSATVSDANQGGPVVTSRGEIVAIATMDLGPLPSPFGLSSWGGATSLAAIAPILEAAGQRSPTQPLADGPVGAGPVQW